MLRNTGYCFDFHSFTLNIAEMKKIQLFPMNTCFFRPVFLVGRFETGSFEALDLTVQFCVRSITL